jgi:integral membrane protein
MPLKYLMGEPLAVRIVGALHGVLFIVYVAAAIRAALINRWKLSFLVKVFVASMLPFGPFIVDRSLRKNTPNGEME